MLARGLRITGAASAAASAAAYALYRYERSKVPADSELVCSLATPATLPPATLKRLTVDNLMGGYDAYYLPAVWFYDQPIDATSLKQTLVRAVDKMPALAGRRCSEGIALCNTGIRFSVRQGHEGSARDWVDGTNPINTSPRALIRADPGPGRLARGRGLGAWRGAGGARGGHRGRRLGARHRGGWRGGCGAARLRH